MSDVVRKDAIADGDERKTRGTIDVGVLCEPTDSQVGTGDEDEVRQVRSGPCCFCGRAEPANNLDEAVATVRELAEC